MRPLVWRRRRRTCPSYTVDGLESGEGGVCGGGGARAGLPGGGGGGAESWFLFINAFRLVNPGLLRFPQNYNLGLLGLISLSR
jgi:hypothetical protein